MNIKKINMILLILIFFCISFFIFGSKTYVYANEIEQTSGYVGDDSIGKAPPTGNALIWFICAVAFLKVSAKIDSIMSSLGINVAHTGSNLLSEAMMTAKVVTGGKGLSGLISGNSSNKNSSEPHYLSGGLAGFVGRKINNSAIESITGGNAGISNKMFESSLKKSGDFANDVIGQVAKGNKGYITGDKANEALSSYMGYSSTGQTDSEKNLDRLGLENSSDDKEKDAVSLGTQTTENPLITNDLGTKSNENQAINNLSDVQPNNMSNLDNSINSLGTEPHDLNKANDTSSQDAVISSVNNLEIGNIGNLANKNEDMINSLGSDNPNDYLNYDSSSASLYDDYKTNLQESQSSIGNIDSLDESLSNIDNLGSVDSNINESIASDISAITGGQENIVSSQSNQENLVSSPINNEANSQIGTTIDSSNTFSNYSNIADSAPKVSIEKLGDSVTSNNSSNINSELGYSEPTSSFSTVPSDLGIPNSNINDSLGASSEPIGTITNSLSVPDSIDSVGDISNTTGNLNDFVSDSNLSNQPNMIPAFSNVEIGNGRITGTETSSSHPNGLDFAMYSTEKYLKPEGDFEIVKTKDGAEWFKQYAVDTIERKPYADLETGEIKYNQKLVKKMPKMPQQKDKV